MERYQYRCNKCLMLEERLFEEEKLPLCVIPCSRCGGLAIRVPASESMSKIFSELGRMNDSQGFDSDGSRMI
jgi:hypothetical protein